MAHLHTTGYKQPANPQSGFTLFELLIYVGLSAIIIGLFGGILITTTRIEGQQVSSADVTRDLSFLMTTIKRYIHASAGTLVTGTHSLVIYPNDTPPTRITVYWDPAPALPVIYLEEVDPITGAAVSQLSSSKIRINDLTFTSLKSGSSTSIQISITASASTTDPTKTSTRTLQSSAATYLQEN